jgi:diacylglycerol kinase family enzyme
MARILFHGTAVVAPKLKGTDSMCSQVTVIVNAMAGSEAIGLELVKTLEGPFRSAGVAVEIILAQNGEAIREAVLKAIRSNPRAVVAGGGDGTINAVAALLVGTDISFGILPLGTLNHFAKDLKIPLDLDAAVRNVIVGRTVKVDVGEVNGRFFVNNSSLGIYPRIVRDRDQQQRSGRRKWVAFFWAVLAVLRRHSFLNVRLVVDGEEHIRRTPFVFVGNNEYEMEGFNIGTRSCLNATQLSAYTVRHERRGGLLMLALRALFGRIRQSKDFDVFCAREIIVESKHRHLHVAIDGEVTMMDTPLRYHVRPASLRVIVPGGIECAP